LSKDKGKKETKKAPKMSIKEKRALKREKLEQTILGGGKK